MKIIVITALAVLLIYVAACCLLYFMQQSLLYYPTPESNPSGFSAEHARSGPVTLKVWSIHTDSSSALLYFGGNSEDVAGNLHRFAGEFPYRAVYLVNYRGYGGSTGSPSEAALLADARLLFDLLSTRHRHIAVMGRSLGSGVATALAVSRPVERIALITPYDSIANVAAQLYRWAPVRWLLRDPYDSAARIVNVRVPVLLLIAGHDEVIARARSEALSAAVPTALRQEVVIGEATHNDIDEYPEYMQTLRQFLAGPPAGRDLKPSQ